MFDSTPLPPLVRGEKAEYLITNPQTTRVSSPPYQGGFWGSSQHFKNILPFHNKFPNYPRLFSPLPRGIQGVNYLFDKK